MGRRKQVVRYRAEVDIVIDGQPWSDDCTIAQVMAQAEREALDIIRALHKSQPAVRIRAPKLVDVTLVEAGDDPR